MFGLHKYLDKIFKVKWYMTASQAKILEDLLYVEFNKQDDHYILENVRYTYVDILLGLENMNFSIYKKGDDICLKII